MLRNTFGGMFAAIMPRARSVVAFRAAAVVSVIFNCLCGRGGAPRCT